MLKGIGNSPMANASSSNRDRSRIVEIDQFHAACKPAVMA